MDNIDASYARQIDTIRRSLLPKLILALALGIFTVLCHNNSFSGQLPTEKRYMAAKADIAKLKQDNKKNGQREPWEKLATEFNSIYNSDSAWPNRPAALFRAGEAFEELAKRSNLKSDAMKAVNCYEDLARNHKTSILADDALFRAASIRLNRFNDSDSALALLEQIKKNYPDGDMLAEAKLLADNIAAAKDKKTRGTTARQAQGDKSVSKAALLQSGDSAGNLASRYQAAKQRMTALASDKTRSCWRQPWEDLRDEFLNISGSDKSRLAPAAMYQAAVCQQKLAECSRIAAEKRKAISMFLEVGKEYPAHALADDALFSAAQIAANNDRQKTELLERILAEYPRGDMAPKAKTLLAEMKPAAGVSKKTASGNRDSDKAVPELQVLSWDSPGKNRVDIVLEFSAPAKYTARMLGAAKGQKAKLLLNLDNAVVVNDVRKGVTVNGSLLRSIQVHNNKNGGASLQFEFREAQRYDVRQEDNSCRIILSVVAGKAKLPQQDYDSDSAQAAETRSLKGMSAYRASQVCDIASQLGLTLQRVFIDAGHGGKDPGTSHNNIVERAITLDVALELGRILQSNNLEVVYSRKKDNFVRLSERTRLANSAAADLFVSIHVNAHTNTAVSGFETYYLDLAKNPQAARLASIENAGSDRHLADMQKMLASVMLNARAYESRQLAMDVQRHAIYRLGKNQHQVRNNGVKSAPFHVLLGAHMPAILVEIGYCSNNAEARNLSTREYRRLIAQGIAEGILAYRKRLQNIRTVDNALTVEKTGVIS